MTEMSSKQSLGSNYDSLVKSMLASYKRLYELLADNNFSQVPAEAVTLRKQIRPLMDMDPPSNQAHYQDLVRKLHGSADRLTPNDIDQARIEFGQFSADLIAFLKDFMPQLNDPLYTVKCPMWNKSPAVWLQDSTQIKNPFLGPDMPTCGTMQQSLQAGR
jgi:hypothetical protein